MDEKKTTSEHSQWGTTLSQSVWLGVGAFLGTRFPDMDQHLGALRFIQHRSILTHGILLALLLLILLRYRPQPWLQALTAGFCATMAVHLCFDLFPRGWYRHALIHIPFYGWTPAWFSWFWIAGSLVGCLYLAGRLLKTLLEITLTLLGMGWAFVAAAQHEPFFWPGAALLVALGVVWLLDRQLEAIINRDKQHFGHGF